MNETQTKRRLFRGRIEAITDFGSIVVVAIDEGDRVRRVPADGNAWRRYGAAENVRVGDSVAFVLTDLASARERCFGRRGR